MGQSRIQPQMQNKALIRAAMHETKAAIYGLAALSAGVFTLASLPLTRAATFTESYFSKTANGNRPGWNALVARACTTPTGVAARIALKCMDLLCEEQAKSEALYTPASEWPRLFFEPREELYAGYDALRMECGGMNLVLPERSYVFDGVKPEAFLPSGESGNEQGGIPAGAEEGTMTIVSHDEGLLHKVNERVKGVLDIIAQQIKSRTEFKVQAKEAAAAPGEWISAPPVVIPPVAKDIRQETAKPKTLEARKEEGVWISSPPLVLQAEKPPAEVPAEQQTASIEAEVKVKPKPKAKAKAKAKAKPKAQPKKVARRIAGAKQKAKAGKIQPKKAALKLVAAAPAAGRRAPAKPTAVKATAAKASRPAKKAATKKQGFPKKEGAKKRLLKKAVRRKTVMAAVAMDPPGDQAVRALAGNISAISAAMKPALQATLGTAGRQASFLKDRIGDGIRAARAVIAQRSKKREEVKLLPPPVKAAETAPVVVMERPAETAMAAADETAQKTVKEAVEKAGKEAANFAALVLPAAEQAAAGTVDVHDDPAPAQPEAAAEPVRPRIGEVYNKSSNDNRSSKLPPFEKISRGVVVSRR